MTRAATIAFALAAFAANAASQTGGDPELHRAAMRKLAFLVGEWEGDGWLATREGRREIRQYEVVRYELGGTILVIEGTARDRTGDAVGEVIFNAFAVVSWTEDEGYRMRSYLWNGLLGDRELRVGEDSFAWGQETPGGPVEYTMEVTDDGAWHEVGIVTPPGGQQFPVIEFRVARTGGGGR